VARLRRFVLILVAVAVGASVAVAGVIGFVGLVIPNLVRRWVGADHWRVLTASALLGSTLLLLADLLARTAFSPTELPIGVVTAAVGGPSFLWLLLRDRGALGR
jgi:iron complex transport system permease protein